MLNSPRAVARRTSPLLQTIFGVAVLLTALLAHPQLAHAATTWNVTPSSACTLADAITASNTAATSGSCAAGSGSGTGVINLAAGTYTLSANLPQISTHALSIVGAGVGNTIIDGSNLYKVFLDGTGALSNVSDLTILHAGNGGSGIGEAIFAESNPFTISNVVVKDSTVDGGLQIAAFSATISNVAVINNQANAYALSLGFTNGTYNVSNLTIYNNQHGMYINPNGSGTINLTNITSSGNGVGIFYQIGGGSPTVNLKNSILNDSTACAGDTVTSQGHNITADNSCGFVGTSNHNNTDAALGSLTASSGTYVLPITYTSPAYDAGDSTGAPSTDQRGVSRPQCDGVDIGAYETTTCAPAPPAGGGGGNNNNSGGSGGTTTKKTTPTTTAPDTTTTPTTTTPTATTDTTTSDSAKPSISKGATTTTTHATSHTTLIWSAVAVLLLGAGGTGWWWFIKHHK
ncbi:MAG TPA: choice-of-anchor Q domain-containing protein [Candidatus Saccharimonadales bacterium]|nr:choice-of-anchor Q domain-containing protein [Candidatus Saccharimonadales bacterium]